MRIFIITAFGIVFKSLYTTYEWKINFDDPLQEVFIFVGLTVGFIFAVMQDLNESNR